MSKKHIARSALEGGRYQGNKIERYQSHRTERAAVREYIGADDFESKSAPKRPKVGRSFDDKLAVPLRWLRSQDGNSWDDVWSELKQRFDVRTTAGRHILYDHVLHWVVPATEVHQRRWSEPELLIDADGILRWNGPARYRRKHKNRLPPGKVRRGQREIMRWARGRRVGGQGQALFWFEPVRTGWAPCHDQFCSKAHYKHPVYTRVHHVPDERCRQTRRLDEEELMFWNSLTEDVQKTLRYPHVQVTVH